MGEETKIDEENAAPLPAVIKQPKAELIAGERVAPIVPRTIEEVARVAKAVIVASLAPDSYRGKSDEETISRVMVGIMKGAEIGLPPLTALANIAIINGRPCLYGDGVVALVQASGKVERWIERYEGDAGTDDYKAVCVIFRKGQDEPYEGKFSLTDAKRAHLTNKKPWLEYPGLMLMWRARTQAIRKGFADCLSGLAIAEEAHDIPQAPPPVDTGFLSDPEPTGTLTIEAQPVA